MNAEPSTYAPRLELVWPGKGKRPCCDVQGAWTLVERSLCKQYRPFYEKERVEHTPSDTWTLAITGDRLDALGTLNSHFPRAVKVAYLDLPRIEIDDKSKAFQGDVDHVWATFLSVIHEHILRVLPLMRRDGVVIVHTSDAEEPYVRCVLAELLGRKNHLGTVVWQRHYAPRGMKGMKEFTATHDPIVAFAIDTEALPPVCLERPATGYSNPDDDPRGEWKAEHKGARTRRAKSDFTTNVPPYRWEVISGALPPGLWRVSPLSGAIWGMPTQVGAYSLTVQVTDKSGRSSKKDLTITVTADGDSGNIADVPWIFAEAIESGGALKIRTKSLPSAVVGKPYQALLLATGGDPFLGKKKPGEGRYWEFADDTLVSAILEDRCWFGPDGTAMPHPKKYLPPGQTTETVNQQTWWPGRPKAGTPTAEDDDVAIESSDNDTIDATVTGFTEDATKHLKKLTAIGITRAFVTTAKPEPLLARLLSIFSRPGDLVLEVFGDAAGLAATALKTGRRSIHLAGHTDIEMSVFNQCSLPRLKGVIAGRDFGLESEPTKPRLRPDAYIPYAGGGACRVLSLGPAVAVKEPPFEYPSLTDGWPTEAHEVRQAILSLEGFLPHTQGDFPHGVTADGRAAAVVFMPGDFLDRQAAADCVTSLAGKYARIVVCFFRAAEDFLMDDFRGHDVLFKRIPMDLGA